MRGERENTSLFETELRERESRTLRDRAERGKGKSKAGKKEKQFEASCSWERVDKASRKICMKLFNISEASF